MIPDEAVEASMSAAVEYLTEWSPNLAAGLDGFDRVFKVALEAAAPHMLAKAWNEGYDYCQGVGSGGFDGNPYEVEQ